MKDLNIDKNNLEGEINQFIGNQGLTILTLNTLGHERFNKLWKDYNVSDKRKSFKVTMLETLYNRELLI